jgi:TolB-like protein/class 3 adenylate cyclase/Tfp pilus assembly protein PilF
MSAEPKPVLELEIAHLLLIDVVGYSKLLANEQIELIQELNRIVRATSCFQAAQTQGKLIRVPTGDGMALIFFRSPEEPARCAIEITGALKLHPNIQIRMGAHSGPINQVTDVNDQVNVAGTGINVAQRVMDCGDAGHILMSKHMAEDLAQYGHWRSYLHDLGEYEVKHGLRIHLFNLCKESVGNPALPQKLRRGKRWQKAAASIVRPVNRSRWPRAILIAAIALSVLALVIGSTILLRRSSFLVTDKSIAVLPFENRSDDKANAYFADGIQDEILTRLSKIADLKVISRTSTQHYKSAPENLPEIARQLGVVHVLEGSVQKSGDSVRVNVQLIKAANDSHVWADTFDRKLTDVFSVESDVAKAVADQLRAKLTGQEERIIVAKPTDNVEAYDAYLHGLAYYLKTQTTPANSLNAQKYFREAVRLDPNFALAWAMLSIVEAGGYISQNLQATIALREEARQAAETALALQPNLGEALIAKGYYHYACLKDYDTATRHLEQARQFLPNSSQIPVALAYVARRRGDWERSEAYFNEAERLDPRSTSLLGERAYSYISLRRFREALQKLDQVLEIAPQDADAMALKANIAQAEGDLPAAAALLAPLRFTADDTGALEVQVYQTILERRPAQIIPRLKEIIDKPNPTLGYVNGELRFWLGWAQEVAGDHVGAQQTWRQARSELEPFLEEQPDNHSLIGDLALTMTGLGDKGRAISLSERAIAANPSDKDAMRGAVGVEILARVAAQMGEPDRAIVALEKLLSIPYAGPLADNAPLTPALLRLDPMFDALRNDPRFQKLVASPVAK